MTDPSLTAVSGKDPGNLMLADLIPACPRLFIIDVHKARMQVSCERITFVKYQSHAVITVSWRMNDLGAQADGGAAWRPGQWIVRGRAG